MSAAAVGAVQQTMRAAMIDAYRAKPRFTAGVVPRPTPTKDSQLLVKVGAAGLNPADWRIHDGSIRLFIPIKFPSVPGQEMCGTVVEAGKAVTRFKPGDRIFAELSQKPGCSFAEYVIVEEKDAALAPEGLSDVEAAGIPLAGCTALQALRDNASVQPGQRVLIVGASGGVGHFAVQIAKALGAHVTGVCSTRNVDFVRGLGADNVIDYTEKDYDLVAAGPFDVVLDTVAAEPVRKYFPAMTSRGVFLPCALSAGRIFFAIVKPLYSRQRVRLFAANSCPDDLDYLSRLTKEGKLRAHVSETFPLEQIADAWDKSTSGRAVGKLAIVPSAAPAAAEAEQ